MNQKIRTKTTVRKKEEPTRYWYKEVPLGVLKISRVGNSFGIIIPKRFVDSGFLKEDERVMVIVLKRLRSLRDELSTKEQNEFKRWCKLKEAEKRVLERKVKELET
ncbi:MAG: hypothetical protein ACTSWZ_05845 [Candidatus Heimdallarchaeaceae archaeon]